MTITRLPISEEAFQVQVTDLAQQHKWKVATFRVARTLHGWRTAVGADGAGWPDLFMVRGGRSLAIELKSATGRLSEEQAAWLTALELAGCETHVWVAGMPLEDMQAVLA